MTEKCLWQEDDDGIWQTECGEAFELLAGTPEENGFVYCPYCGQALKQKRYKGWK